MHPIVADRQAELAALCRQHHVRRLELFGSAASGRFDPATSDLDFIVEIEALEPLAHGRALRALHEGLEQLFARKVDLIAARSIRNPYFAESVNETRVTVYDAVA